jgi:ubiquinol-cytochrome c reductase cytochrome c subunit
MTRLGVLLARRPSLGAAAMSLAITGALLVAQGGAQASVQQPGTRVQSGVREQGRELFVTGCSGCHGLNGQGLKAPDGSARGPSLKDAGEAGAYYYLHTGRMPLADPEDVPVRKDPAYNESDMRALVAYVGSLGHGPRVPDVNVRAGNLADGGEQFRGNCAACHSASGAGGALSYGRAAPSLAKATPGRARCPVSAPRCSTRRNSTPSSVTSSTCIIRRTPAAWPSAVSARFPKDSSSGCSAWACCW